MTISEQRLAKEPLALVNELLIKALEAPNRQALQFIIANDTHQLIPYDRAILWEVRKEKVGILAISGQSTVSPYTEFYKTLNDLPKYLKDPDSIQMLSSEALTNNQEAFADYQRANASSILWLPIHYKDSLILGLWIERWNVSKEEQPSQDTLNLLSRYLLPGYGATWSKFRLKTKMMSRSRKWFFSPFLLLPLLLLVLPIPLRIVAPCEVVPKDPFIVTAPLQGTIEEIVVEPGKQVQKGDVLIKYDRRAPTQELKIAQNEVAITEAALHRALALGLHDQASLDDVAILKLKLEKEKINLELAESNVEHLDVKAQTTGVVVIEDRDQWPGKPVRIGEKILTIADLAKTKIKMWIQENDNIEIDMEKPIKIFLNVNPEKQWPAHLTYIASEVTVSDKQIPSFVAEAEWADPDTHVKPGLKGTAVLYGPRVTLFYYLIRKPWILVREVFGI